MTANVRLIFGPLHGEVREVADPRVRTLRFQVGSEIRWADDYSEATLVTPDALIYERMVQPAAPRPGAPRYVDAIDAYGRPVFGFIRTERGDTP